MKNVLDALLAHPGEILASLTFALGIVLGAPTVKVLKAKLREQRAKMVLQAVRIAFGAAEEAARLTKTEVDDKLAVFGVKITECLIAMGEEPLDPLEQPLVKHAVDALSAETKLNPTLPQLP